MLYETPHLRIDLHDGIATMWLAFPGSPVNALTSTRLNELGKALTLVEGEPSVEILVIRSGLPGGFCGGFELKSFAEIMDEEEVQTRFARTGQELMGRLAKSELVTVAFLEGPCLGPGMELALSCDYRLAVAGPDSWLGFSTDLPTCWNPKSERYRELGMITAREAYRLGMIDDAFCERRGKIDLRTWLDRLQAHPKKPRPWFWQTWWTQPLGEALAMQRMNFREAMRTPEVIQRMRDEPIRQQPFTELPKTMGVIGPDKRSACLAVEAAMRGVTVVAIDTDEGTFAPFFAEALRRGRLTPLEAETARKRLCIIDNPEEMRTAQWILILGSEARLPFLRHHFSPGILITESLEVPCSTTVAGWLQRLGECGVPISESCGLKHRVAA
jgi:enoyl-CoA hydratase